MAKREISYYRPHDSSPLTSRPRTKPRRLTIGQLGLRERFGPGLCRRDGGTPAYYLLMFFNGAMRIAFGDERQEQEEQEETPPGTLVLWRPDHKHVYGTVDGEAVAHSYVFFNGPGIAPSLERLGLRFNAPIAGVSQEQFEHGIGELYDELARPDEDERVVWRLLEVLILRAAREARSSQTEGIDPRIARVRHRIDRSYNEPLSLDDLAAEAELSPNYLCMMFKRQYECSPHEMLTRLRMQLAMQLLADTDQRVLDIAARTGYEDPYYFSRQFKAHAGISPREYRDRKQRRSGP